MKRMVQEKWPYTDVAYPKQFFITLPGRFLIDIIVHYYLSLSCICLFLLYLSCKQCIVVSTSCIWKVKLCSHKFLPVNKSNTFNVFRKNNRSIHLTQGGRSNNHMLRTGVPNGQIYQLNWLVTIQASSSFDKNKYTNQMKAVTTPCVTSD